MADAPQPKRKTIAALEAALADIEGRRKHAMDAADTYKRAAISAEDEVKQVRAQFADLKERLATAEQLNAEMRGYLKRVQEDDVVREELVPIGDPGGEQQLVPKRKPTPFMAPTPYSDFSNRAGDSAMSFTERRNRPQPRHWVTY